MAIVRIGLSSRGQFSNTPNGNIPFIQPKDIVDNSLSENLNMIEADHISALHNYLLLPNDILISNKGVRFATFLYQGFPTQAIASASFFIIKADQKKILPQYLQWYLEQETTKTYLLNASTSSTVPSINKPVIENLVIPIPSLKFQQKAIELLQTVKEEREQLFALAEKRKQYGDSYIWELINKNKLWEELNPTKRERKSM